MTESGTTGASVSCASTALLYVASADNSVIAGYRHSFTVRIAPYHGLGSYRALVTLTIMGPHGDIASASRVPTIPATITSSGGNFTIDTTGARGQVLDASVSWACP